MMRVFNKKRVLVGAGAVLLALVVLCMTRCGDDELSPPEGGSDSTVACELLRQVVQYSHDLYSEDPEVNDADLLRVRYYDLLRHIEDLPPQERERLEKHPEYQAAVERVRRFKEQMISAGTPN